MPPLSALDPSVLRAVADVLGDTDNGLTNREIDDLLLNAGIDDPTPRPRDPNVFVRISKRDRLYNALEVRQRRDRAANAVIHFIECAMKPVRYRTNREQFVDRHEALNEALSFVGLILNESGRIVARGEAATTLKEARARSRRLRRQLEERGVHPRILSACGSEIADDNYFHTVLEATKSVAAEIRTKSGLAKDGVELVDAAFEKGQRKYPLLASNALQTPTQLSEQRGLAHLLRGMFQAFRNPTAHEPRVDWPLSEQDALDALMFISMLHRKLDACTPTQPLVTPASTS